MFTKDIAYQQGFMLMGGYIESRLENGDSISEIMEYLLQGKFDPTNHQHTEYIATNA